MSRDAADGARSPTAWGGGADAGVAEAGVVVAGEPDVLGGALAAARTPDS